MSVNIPRHMPGFAYLLYGILIEMICDKYANDPL